MSKISFLCQQSSHFHNEVKLEINMRKIPKIRSIEVNATLHYSEDKSQAKCSNLKNSELSIKHVRVFNFSK